MLTDAAGEKPADVVIVCDTGCDLPSSFLAGLPVAPEVASADGTGTAAAGAHDMRAELVALYRRLASAGKRRIVSVHSSEAFSPIVTAAWAAAEDVVGEAEVVVIDSGTASAATGMVVERLSTALSVGVGFEEAVRQARGLAASARLLVVPASSAGFARRRTRPSRAGLLGRATGALRVRLSSERGLYLLSRGEVTQLARSTSLVELTSRLVHSMSKIAANEGELVYALVETGDARALRAVEKPLDTNEFDSRSLGTVSASAPVLSAVGEGAVAVAVAPAAVFDRIG